MDSLGAGQGAAMRRWWRRVQGGIAIAAAVLATVALVPEVLAFPHRQAIGDTIFYAEQPLPATMPALLARSDAMLRHSALYQPGYGRRIFLTDGGWRWRLLALSSSGAFAFSRPFGDVIVVNRSDPTHDLVFNGQAIGGRRALSDVLAHERTHALIRARYGLLADLRYPAWLREGYCDVVSGGGSLSDAQAAALEAEHRAHPALLYYHGRKRVDALLRAAHGDVDRVFAEAVR
ncbi:hypothetical protein [Sphingomonas sp. CARO-RG-8B-R24-01]|uniref:hypothetical protein n=1 Tax=Sphingomonas sp. CARO-RG-8B-R24-01 TaxID=2914831 RepID=UPI001F5976FB|nr:hypothetical protein [Sphingomonas sp. CARO-RG-8B-R24-01]